MSKLLCSFCGYDNPPFEMHHIASRHNHPHWTVRACQKCHHIADAWNYADRIVERGKPNKEPQSEREKHDIMLLAMARIAEMSAHANALPESMLLLGAITEMYKHDSTLPEPKYRNQEPTPLKPLAHNTERVTAAFCAIFAYFMEEWLGRDHPLPRLMRDIELRPLAWTFDNSPGLTTFDLSSETAFRGGMFVKFRSILRNGFDEITADYMRRWAHK